MNMVDRILENYFLYQRGGYEKAAQQCLETAKVFCKDDFDKRYNEVKERMEAKFNGQYQREVASTVSGIRH